MPLTPCSMFYGTAEILSSMPSVDYGRECIYSPFSSEIFFDRHETWGIYNIDGHINDSAAYVRGPECHLVGQSRLADIDILNADIVSEHHIYFGPLIPHYGHFLVSSLARAWFYSSFEDDNVRLLCHSDHPVESHMKSSFMGSFIPALGLKACQFARPTKPTRFTNLTVPSAAFIEEKMAYTAFLTPMHNIGDFLLNNSNCKKGRRSVYLSKSRMGTGSVTHISNELEIEAILEGYGVEIIHPQSLSVEEQVRIFSSCDKVLGFVGSAFHNHIFVREPPIITAIALNDFVNSNLIMLDRLNNAESTYLFPKDGIEEIEQKGYQQSRRITDVKSFVDDLLDASKIARGNTFAFDRGVIKESASMYDENVIPDHQGESYLVTLQRLHDELRPKTYLEIGTLNGTTLKLSAASSISIDPKFQIVDDVIGQKPQCFFFQVTSDFFFSNYNPVTLMNDRLNLSFLDGMHRCEFLLRDFINAERHSSPHGVIVLHDCLPVEIPMTDRTQNGTPAILQHRAGWWTGDVWRTLLALKRYRNDLKILCLDASPTGLVIIGKLNPESNQLSEGYEEIVAAMMKMNMEDITINGFLQEIEIRSTATYSSPQALLNALSLNKS